MRIHNKKFLSVRREGNRQVQRTLVFYNLDMIISVGYRVKSAIATRFRIWATERLKEYIVKGFTIDDQRLKELKGGRYFEELLARIRDIRSSEKVFWRKVLDTGADYSEETLEWAVRIAMEARRRVKEQQKRIGAAELMMGRPCFGSPAVPGLSIQGHEGYPTNGDIIKDF